MNIDSLIHAEHAAIRNMPPTLTAEEMKHIGGVLRLLAAGDRWGDMRPKQRQEMLRLTMRELAAEYGAGAA